MNYDSGIAPYAEIYSRGKFLGRSYLLTNTQKLFTETQTRLSAIAALKETSRFALKETMSNEISDKNALLGEMLRIIMFAFEIPDTRRCETIPLWLQVARVPCPSDMKSYKIVFKNSRGKIMSQKIITNPLSSKEGIFISFCRDL